tara:strand:- start:369 stop:1382 length:1014 start_codon:yes stop_codon:yes gene_type:complete
MSEEELDYMDEIGYEHAYASQIAYIYEEYGYNAAEEALMEEFPLYTIDPELSDNYSVTILKPDGSTILAYRGTDFTRPDDLMADAVIASGLYKVDALQYLRLPDGAYEYIPAGLTRFGLSQEKYQKVVAKHGDDITITGHSKGGTLASYIGRVNKKESYIFNAGAVPNLPHDPRLDGPEFQSNSNTYLVKGDIISMFGAGYTPKEKVKYIKRTAEGSWPLANHSLQNFLTKPPKQIEPPIQKPTQTKPLTKDPLAVKNVPILASQSAAKTPFTKITKKQPISKAPLQIKAPITKEPSKPKAEVKIPKSLVLSDMKFTDPVIIRQICKEFPELCPRGD